MTINIICCEAQRKKRVNKLTSDYEVGVGGVCVCVCVVRSRWTVKQAKLFIPF